MTTSRLRELNEPAVFVPEVAKQHEEFVLANAFGVDVISRAKGFDWMK